MVDNRIILFVWVPTGTGAGLDNVESVAVNNGNEETGPTLTLSYFHPFLGIVAYKSTCISPNKRYVHSLLYCRFALECMQIHVLNETVAIFTKYIN